MGVAYPPLGHGAKTRIDSVDDFILMELLQEMETALHLEECFGADAQLLAVEDDIPGLLQVQMIHILQGKENWLVHEFLSLVLGQFMDEIACEITKQEIMPTRVK